MDFDKAREAVQTPKNEYHLQELKIALDSDNPAHYLPTIQTGLRVLDVGCGAGQTLIAACPYRMPGEGGGCVTCARKENECLGWACGVDIDDDAIRLGHAWSRTLQLQHASAEHLPYKDQEFDIVISLCRSHVRRHANGPFRNPPCFATWWQNLVCSLHRFSDVTRQIGHKNWRGLIFLAYVALNGVLFHLSLRTWPLFGRREYWQTPSAMRRVLAKYGFEDIQIEMTRGFLIVSACLAISKGVAASASTSVNNAKKLPYVA